MNHIIFPNSTYDQNKNCILLTATLLVARPKFVVILILLQAILSGGLPCRLPQIVSLWVCRTSFNISPSRQAVVIVPPPRSVVRSSAEAPLFFAKSSDDIVVCNVCAVAER